MLLKTAETRIDPRMKRTRQMLQQALMALMAEQTFQSITVQDIAERATVNRATFYDHFVDKFALLEYAIRDTFEHALRERLPEDTELSIDGLRTLIEIVCMFMHEGHKHCKPADAQLLRLVESQTTAQLVEVLRGWLEEARRADAPVSTSVEMTANAVGWAIFGAALHWEDNKNREPVGEFAASLLPFIIGGLHHEYVIEGVNEDHPEVSHNARV